MNILMMTGSPHKKGTSALLAEQFAKGAAAAGHQIAWADTAFMDIHGCRGCDHCRTHGGVCIHKDDFLSLSGDLLKADLVAFATPLYYFGMSSHLKAAIDRFYASNETLMAQNKKAVLLATCADTESWAPEALKAHYAAILRYLGWEDRGILIAPGMAVRSDIEASDYPAAAFKMGSDL